VFNKSFLAIFILAFLAIGCTHSPTKPELDNSANSDYILTDPSKEDAQKADFISPPLDRALNKNALIDDESNTLIWQHIEDKLELTEIYDHPRVALQKRKFLNNSDYLAKVTRRSEPFIHFILSEIERRQMPAELAILPIVESGYYPRARSRASAEGLWQIMPFTAKDLGLKRYVGYDGRHDVYAATSAALDYLSQMYNKFDGDWLLALAAYNAGPQRVKRALRKAEVHDENVYWNLRLPRETREYVPKILALSAIINDAEYSTTLLHPIENKPYLESIELTKRILPAKLIQAAAASETEIKLLNPAIRNLNTPIPAGYHLLVPKREAEFLTLAINNMEEAAQPTWAKHKIRRGESLSGIARRYGTSIRALRDANNIHGNKIVSGRTLVVPLAETVQTKAVVASREVPAIVEASSSPEKANTPYVHVVALGDSLWKIANRNNTTVKRLFEINGLTPGQPLKPGETIRVD